MSYQSINDRLKRLLKERDREETKLEKIKAIPYNKEIMRHDIVLFKLSDKYVNTIHCEICGIGFGRNVKKCVDHCHKTLDIRGVICGQCNSGLGMFKDDVALMQQAISYLIKIRYDDEVYERKIPWA